MYIPIRLENKVMCFAQRLSIMQGLAVPIGQRAIMADAIVVVVISAFWPGAGCPKKWLLFVDREATYNFSVENWGTWSRTRTGSKKISILLCFELESDGDCRIN